MRPAARALVVRRGLVLVVEHDGDPYRIGLPGGGVELGETPAEAACRELEEETGLCAVSMAPLTFLQDDRRSTWVFVVDAAGRPRSSHEGLVRWAAPDELLLGKHALFHEAVLGRAGLS